MWKGRFEDFMISSCKRVEPLASTTLPTLRRCIYYLYGGASLHEVSLLQSFKCRCHVRPPFTMILRQPRSIYSHPALIQSLPVCSCQAPTSLFLTPSSHCAGVTPLASSSQFSTRLCVTSISSTA